MDFFDIQEQSKYVVTVSQPKNMEDLSDSFISREELKELTGHDYKTVGAGGRTIMFRNMIAAEVKKLTDKLDASGKKSIRIEDEELLEVLQGRYFSSFSPSGEYGRYGDRVCYARRYKRKKTKATQGDVRELWNNLQRGWNKKYGCWPSYIPVRERHIHMFKAFQKIIGWRLARQHSSTEQAKFFRQIWDNPEEYFK